MTFKLKGSYAPAVEQKSKHAVSVIVLDVPRPPRDNPPPTVIEVASSNGNDGKDAVAEVREAVLRCGAPVDRSGTAVEVTAVAGSPTPDPQMSG